MNSPHRRWAAGMVAACGLLSLAPGSWAAFPDLRLVPVSSGAMTAPVGIAHSGDGTGRLFIVDQLGTIRILNTATDTLLATPFLDLTSKVIPLTPRYDERGLLGLAFHPDYAVNGAAGEGKFYVYYSAVSPNAPGTATDPVNHQSVVAEYTVSAADANVANPASERILLTLDEPQSNHNGGCLVFGPDSKLYISLGDGGSQNDNNAGHTGGSSSPPADALGNGQDKTKLLGKILRIDPLGTNGPGGQYGIPADNPFVNEVGGVRKEIFAYGLRNPWRMSFDRANGRLFVADVGQLQVEEINLVTSGGNYGWRNREGSFDFAPTAPGTGPFVDPIAQYAHPGTVIGNPELPQIGTSVTGGEVYRGTKIPGLVGKYVFADWSTSFTTPNGTMLGLEETSPDVFSLSTLSIAGASNLPFFITSLGSDEAGELYVATRTVGGPKNDTSNLPTGTIFRIEPVYQPQQVTLPADRDNTIYSELPSNSNGAGANLFAGNVGGAGNFGSRRALVRFDLSALPAGAAVTSASITMNLNRDASQATTLSWHRVTDDWGEGTSNALEPGGQGTGAAAGDATWSHRFFNTQTWATAGGSFVATASASQSVGGLGLKTWTSAGLAQDATNWRNGVNPNYGWILRDPGTDVSAKRFSSREASNSSLRPKLSVTYLERASVVTLLGLSSGTDTGASSTDGVTSSKTPVIRGYAPLGATVKIQANGTDVGSQVVTTLPFAISTTTTLSEGVNTITATSTENGQTGPLSNSLVITIDSIAPTITKPDLVAASDTGSSNTDNVTKQTKPAFVASSEAGATVQFSSDVAGAIGSGVPGSAVTSSVVLADGVHQITAVATDLAGNTSSSSSALSVTIDTSAPAAPAGLDLLPASDLGNSSSDDITYAKVLSISGTAESGSTVTLTSSLAGLVGTVTSTSTWTIQTGLLSGGVHSFTARATDLAGNLSDPSAPLQVTVIDARAAKPVAVPASPVGLSGVNAIAWDPSAAGIYDGLLRDFATNTTVVGAVSKFTVSSTGAFSGTVLLNGKSGAIRGSLLLPGGSVTASLPVARSTPVDVDLQLSQTTSGGFVIRGRITWDGTVTRADLPLAVPVSPGDTGPYTLLIPSESSWALTDPEGDGWARISIASNGGVTVTGVMGDGVPFTEAAYVSADRELQLFTYLYPVNAAGNRGYAGARLVLRSVTSSPGNAPVSDFDGKLYWRKYPDVRQVRYPDGFNLVPWAIGSKFSPVGAGTRVLALANQEYNAGLSFIGAAAPSTTEGVLDRVLTWTENNKLVHYGPQSLTGAASRTNGGISGSFSDPAAKGRVSFGGVAFQKQNIAAGNFVRDSAAGAVRILPGTTFSYPGSEEPGAALQVGKPLTPATPPSEINPSFDPAAAGRYDGIISTDSGIVSGGLESVTLTAAGGVSGTLWVNGKRYAFRSTMSSAGKVSFSLDRPAPALPILFDLDLTLAEAPDSYGLAGLITVDGVEYRADAQRLPVFTKLALAPQAGTYTLAMLAPAGLDALHEPGGNGAGTMRVSTLGFCTGQITLADGTLATLGGHVGRVYDDESVDFSEWSFHRGLYGKTPKGYLAGKLTFRIVPGVSAVDGTWRWVKHAGAAPVAPYPSFAINGTVIGAKYHPPTTGPAISGLSNAFHNSWLRFDGPGLGAGSTLNRVATWTSTNQLIYYGPEAVTLSFRAASGALSGTYRDATGLNLKFSGAVIQGQTKELVIGAYQAAGLSGGFQVEPR